MADQLPHFNPENLEKSTTAPDESEELTNEEIVDILGSYRTEAENARQQGSGSRDEVWEDNIDLYWNDYDFSTKAPWQAQEILPEAPQFVNRFAAAMRQFLTRDGEYYSIEDMGDTDSDLAPAVKKLLNYWLSRCSHNVSGHPIEFASVFEDMMKSVAMMAASASVSRKESKGSWYVGVDLVDPRSLYFDPTGRNLYRIATFFIDKHELQGLASSSDKYDKEQIDLLQSAVAEEERVSQERIAAHGKDTTSPRQTIRIDEYLCDLVDHQGNLVYENHLFIVANDRWLIRGPEKNPFKHGMDWIVFSPAVSVPFSVYGKTYMEDWAGMARAFTELTNMIIDAVYTNSMNAYVGRPNALEDPVQMEEGIHPSKIFYADENEDIRNILNPLELGNLPAEAITLWQAFKKELQEGALFSEIALGQLSSGEKTATEIAESQQGSATTLQSIAKNIETNLLEPILNLVWKTGLENMSKKDKNLERLLGPEAFAMFLKRKNEFIERDLTFRVQAISGLIERNEKFRKIMQLLQIVGSNELLLQTFVQQIDPKMLVQQIFKLNGIELSEFQPQGRAGLINDTAGLLQKKAEQAKESLANSEQAPNPSEVFAQTAGAIAPLVGGKNGGK